MEHAVSKPRTRERQGLVNECGAGSLNDSKEVVDEYDRVGYCGLAGKPA